MLVLRRKTSKTKTVKTWERSQPLAISARMKRNALQERPSEVRQDSAAAAGSVGRELRLWHP
eukprot:2625223-Pleurochrysis_carterae.AAC.2